jgi:2-polyprenyl-6-methoxyphenol hydroxylase-like FAD-dependent oxidoreductase
MQQGARALRALGFMNDDFDTSDTNKEATNNPGTKFGIHSTRHAVHKPNGECIGEWGLSVWGGRYEKNGRSHATRQNAHISRQNLRRVLMDMLMPGSVRWGYRFMGYDESNDLNCNGDKALALKFSRRVKQADGTEKQVVETVHSSILVGCDGIRSAVRACKLGEEIAPLRYLGCIVILGIGPSPNDSLLTDGRTVFQTADGVTRLYAMPYAEPGEDVAGLETSNENGLSMWQLSFPMTERDADDLTKLGSAALKAEALRRCGKWHDPIPALLDSTPEQLVTGYPCYDRALVDKNDLRNGLKNSQSANSLVTMLGDAAHPMSPFKGQGANQALLDAVLLAQKIYGAVRKVTKTESTLDDLMPCALGEFENEMLQRCAVKVKKSAEAAKFLHSEVAVKEGNVTRGAAAVLD